MPEYFLGVDGGQSSTTAFIGDGSGKTIGWGSAGPCNQIAAVDECVSNAATCAGIEEPVHFKSACLGMSGGADDKAAQLRERIDADHMVVTHDAAIALAGATAGEPGVVVIGGTGSIAFGQNARGETARAGGWGYIFGDEGGAFDIVRQALRAVLREHEGWGARSALMPALVEAVGAPDANEMLHRFYTPAWPRSRVAELAKTVDRIAEESDPFATGVLHNAAQQLAALAGAVRTQLFSDAECVRMSWVGGVFESRILLSRFREIVSLHENVQCEPPRHGPAHGALLLAYRAAGLVYSRE